MLTISGAYGRDYRSLKAMKEDLARGKDFIIRTMGRDEGRYISLPELAETGQSCELRYAKDAKVGFLTASQIAKMADGAMFRPEAVRPNVATIIVAKVENLR